MRANTAWFPGVCDDEEAGLGSGDEESWMMLDTEERKRRKEEANRREAAHHEQEDTQPARSLGELIDHLPPLTDDHQLTLLCCAVDCVRDEDLTQLSRQLRGQAGAGPELVAALLVAARSVHLTS